MQLVCITVAAVLQCSIHQSGSFSILVNAMPIFIVLSRKYTEELGHTMTHDENGPCELCH